MLVHCLVIVLLASGHLCAGDNPVVETPLGSVQGYTSTSFNGRTVLAFEGIPFAKPPIGEKRFEEPEPVDPWNDVWNATAVTSCVQVIPQYNIIMGYEDCLHVNVYVPREKIEPKENLDVVVHIHGGAFYTGSGNLYSKPTYVTDKEVIFVTFNYRLTVFGFLSTEDEVVPGNMGLKDQVLALKWVKDNIASFGGNPDSITAYGLSAGSASVHLHYLSEQSKGLFHKGFCQSGTGLNSWSIVEGNLDRAKKLATLVDCPSDSTKELVDCLKELPFETIAQQVQYFAEYKNLPLVPFGPVVEKGGSNPFIADYPYKLLEKGQVLDLPLLVSNTPHEGLVIVGDFTDQDYADLNKDWNQVLPIVFDYTHTLPEESWTSAAEAIRQHYFGDEEVTPENYLTLVQAMTERGFEYDDETTIRLQANVTTSPVYYYIFGYIGNNNPAQTVAHGAEVKYMFGSTDLSPTPLTENELKIKDLLWDMVVSFAKTGVPSLKDVEWPPTTYDKDVYVYVSGSEPEDIELKTADELSDREFWSSLKFLENENLP